MDVKSKFQSPPKGTLVADTKKSQDVYPKNLRKKEPAGANGFSRNEQSRKFNLQRTKDIVKRPRTKGQYHGGTEENTKVVAGKWAEHGSVLVHGRKKENNLLNGNHLLNFHYEPRDAQRRSVGKSTRRYSYNSNRWLPSVQKHKYNKEQFIQASYQFVVTANGNYSPYLTDPDILVDWKLIEQVNVYSSESLSCPICLYEPVAGKMTRCGHVYCWSCILHYMRISDKNGACCKCPICYEFVHKTELKSVIEIPHSTFNLGDTLNLRLMRREKGSVLATPVISETSTPATFLSASEDSNNQIYSKLLIANAKDIVNIIRRERDELRRKLEEDQDCYIKQALNELSLRESKLSEITESEDAVPATENATEKDTVKQTSRENEGNIVACCKNDTKSSAERSPESAESASNDSRSVSSPSKFVYFYQAEDGQHLYLHAMNVKMLEMQYGGLEYCPPVITGKVLEKEAGSYTEDLKRRLRYLSHLPLTCQFELVEIELKPPLVSEEVLHSFRGQLNSRQKGRKCREHQEKKREKRITEEQDKCMGRYPTPRVNIESRRHFPQWMPELLSEETSSFDLSITSSVASSPSSSDSEVTLSLETDPSHEQQQQGPSFAEMLRTTRAKSTSTWPSVASTVQSKSLDTAVTTSYNEDDEEAYYVSPPSKNQSLGEALARAFNQTKLEPGAGNDGNAVGKKNRKKKKEKATVLFATDMARGSC